MRAPVGGATTNGGASERMLLDGSGGVSGSLCPFSTKVASLGTNPLLDIVVFGRRAGVGAAEHAVGLGFAELPDDPAGDARRSLEELAGHPRGERAAAIRADLQSAMDDRAGVYRTDALLKEMEELLGGLRRRYDQVWVQDTSRSYNTDLLETVELGFLLDLAEALVVSARARTESRGGHFREDFPKRDDETWLRHTLAWKAGDGIKLDYKPVTITRYQPMERTY